jgi:hypothetical protein
MVYRTPYPWYFDPSAYLLIRNEGVKIPWMKIDPGVNLPWGTKYHPTKNRGELGKGRLLLFH